MTDKTMSLRPTLIMETSWEVCNKVGGIYAVLSTRSATMTEVYGRENIVFVGPWLSESEQRDFVPSFNSSGIEGRLSAEVGLPVHIGTWDVPGHPLCILVDYKPLYKKTGALYFEMWERYGIRSEEGYGDYDESCHFAIAAAMVIDAYAKMRASECPVAIFNEWTTGMGLLWLGLHAPEVATMFITHATSVGRSIAGNGKELYKYMRGYNGDQMAQELNVVGKHVVEKKAAWRADTFSTVSEVTNVECAQLLDKPVDQIIYNGFEQDFVPDAKLHAKLRAEGRRKLIDITKTLYGTEISGDILIVGTSGRSEYRNKGLDVFIESLRLLAERSQKQQIMAVIAVPSWVQGARTAINFGIESGQTFNMPMVRPYMTHDLYDTDRNAIACHLESLKELWGKTVFPLFIPSYLDGHDGVLNIPYYDFLPTLDVTVFPSYYEPWGYTPLESMAFGIPSVTTDKTGYGMWAVRHTKGEGIREGIAVLQRTDDNVLNLTENIANTIQCYAGLNMVERSKAQTCARSIASQADWHHFFPQYIQAFEIALRHKNERLS